MITTARIAKSWSLQQLGEAVGTVREGGTAVSPQFSNDVEHDRGKSSAELLHAFAKILHLDIDVVHCTTGEGLPFVNAYLQAHPRTRPEIAASASDRMGWTVSSAAVVRALLAV